MKSLSVSRIVVVADSGQGKVLATRLRRMNVAEVKAVTELEEARRLVNRATLMLAWWRSMRLFPIAYRPLKAKRQDALAAFRP
jgi:hypothetical protein